MSVPRWLDPLKTTYSPFTIVAKLFFTCKNVLFVNEEVRAGSMSVPRWLDPLKTTYSPFTIVAKLFFTCKNLLFVNEEVRAGSMSVPRWLDPLKNWQSIYNCCKTIFHLYQFIFRKRRSKGREAEVRAHYPIIEKDTIGGYDLAGVQVAAWDPDPGVRAEGSGPWRSAGNYTSSKSLVNGRVKNCPHENMVNLGPS